jgi:hypothetical protein
MILQTLSVLLKQYRHYSDLHIDNISFGADNLAGGPGNDILVHGHAWQAESDGHKDVLDCGPGEDTAYANLTIDHDVVSNCEEINPE